MFSIVIIVRTIKTTGKKSNNIRAGKERRGVVL